MKIVFKSELCVEHVGDGLWKILRDFIVAVRPNRDSLFFDEGEVIVVPAGFITDFASVPRLPGVYWLLGGIGQKSAVVHDFLYSTRYWMGSRARADRIFRNGLLSEGVSRPFAWVMWAAVRCCGWRFWKKSA